MTIKVGVVMDPPERLHYKKDTTVAMLLAAQNIGWEIYYLPYHELKVCDGEAMANAYAIQITDNPALWYQLSTPEQLPLASLNLILMRQDPPFNIEYIYTTYILELAEKQGVTVVNKPQSLRDANEKLFTTHFPQCCPPLLVSRNLRELRKFWEQHQQVVFKPLHGMGGNSVFVVNQQDLNVNVILETLTGNGEHYIMGQRYIPDIVTSGDKRVILIGGVPVPYALARIPAKGDIRGNLVAGATGVVVELTPRDYWICEQLAPVLQQKQLVFVGIDIIGEYLTEINVTSPTGVKELTKATGINIAGMFIEYLQQLLSTKKTCRVD